MVTRAERDPKSSVRIAMRAVADENRSFLKDITLSLPYANFREACSLQQFEASLYLAISDLYESVEEVERERMCRHWKKPLAEIRESSLYAILKEEVVKVAAALANEEDLEGREWIKSKRAIARKRIVRTITEGSGRKALLAASEIVDRDMPKQPRAGGGNTNVVIFSPESAALVEKALSITKPKEKLIGPGSE